MAKNTYTARPIDRLWGAVRGWAIVYLLASGALVAATGYRLSLLAGLPSDMGMTEMDVLPGGDLEMVATTVASLVWVLAYFVAGFLTLKWFYRATNNANAFSAGVENSPAWALWGFVIPLVSLWKPYGVASELWRTSLAPDRWMGLRDPLMMRWWWGLVLVGNLALSLSNLMSKNAITVLALMLTAVVTIAGTVLHIAAGVLFLRIAGPISARQTELIGAGRIAPSEATQPAWAP
ncbi:DUF4328 domain-containing protein [Brevundimonas sp.]|uniref:DUF4328 domain-containing protein n=1 Tax=Brevundimonas sp. TaxID=1871086 RepID=UPI0025BF09AB|nr:DUF4328 domain-containing protein [Brevundimonas sp.]